MNTEKLWNTFYQKLGYLCYAIASSDKKISDEEIAKLKELVKTEWVSVEHTEDRFGSDAAYQIEILFDWLEENIPPTDWAFEQFSDFVKEYKPFFTPELKAKVLKTADLLASSFNAKNKHELTMLFQLHQMLH